VKPHWPKVRKWQGVGSMIDALLGLLQQSPPQAETKFSKSLLDDVRYESLLQSDPQGDPTKISKMRGSEVALMSVNKVMDILGDTGKSVKPLMMHTALKESKYGDDPDTFNFRKTEEGTVGHGGIFQITDKAVKDIVNDPRKRIKRDLKLLSQQGIDPVKAIKEGRLREFLEVPLNSAAMARMHYKLFNEPLPDIENVKAYYAKRYAPQSKKK